MQYPLYLQRTQELSTPRRRCRRGSKQRGGRAQYTRMQMGANAVRSLGGLALARQLAALARIYCVVRARL